MFRGQVWSRHIPRIHTCEKAHRHFHRHKSKGFRLPKCHKELAGVLLKKCTSFQEDSGLLTAPLPGEQAPWKVPVLPLGWQAAAKRKKLGDCRRTMVSPCQVISGHIQLNTFCNCQLEKGTSAARSLLSTTCYPSTGARPGTCWESRTGRLHSPTSPQQLKSSPTINMLLSRSGPYKNQPFLQESSSRISSSC